MSLIKLINKKEKSTVIFSFSVISLLLLIPSTVISAMIFDVYSAIIYAVVLMLCAIPFHCFAKKWNALYLISFLLNSIANGLSVSAYYIHTKQKLSIANMLLAILPFIAILAMTLLIYNVFKISKKCSIITSVAIDSLLATSALVLWIVEENLILSFGFFSSLITLFYIMVMGISLNNTERKVLRDISFGSFGSFIIITIVVLCIISEGDALADIATITPDSTSSNKKTTNH